MSWTQTNLATTQFQAPRAFTGPAAYLFSNEGTRHIIYLGADASGQSNGIIWEGFCGDDDQWHFQNLTAIAENNPPPAVAAPTAYAFEPENSQHVLYRTAGDEHIHELYRKDSDNWKHSDLMKDANVDAPPISGQPFGWEFQRVQNIVYMGDDRLVHLLSRGIEGDINFSGWTHQPLTKPGDPPCAVPPGGYSSKIAGTQHVNYRSDNHRLFEIVGD